MGKFPSPSQAKIWLLWQFATRSVQNADCRLSTKCRLTRKNFFLRQKRVNIRFYNFVLFTHAKTFHRVFMALIDRDRITSRLNYDNKLFCTTLFWCSLKRTSVKLTKLLVRCLNASWKSFYVNLHVAFERLAFVASHRSHAVTPRWLDDDKECIQSVWSKQRDCCSYLAHEMLVASKAVFLENYLAVSTWILNGSSIECHEKKHQPFSLSGVRFGSRAIQISGWNSAWRWAIENWLLITCSKSQCKTNQIAQIHHFVTSKQFKWKT